MTFEGWKWLHYKRSDNTQILHFDNLDFNFHFASQIILYAALCRSSENFRFLLVTQKHRGGIWFILQHVNKPKHKAKVIKNWLHQQEQDRWRLPDSPELESMEPGFLGLHAVTEDIKSAWIYSTAFKMLETAYLLFANSAEVCLILKAFYCPLHRVNRQISLWADVIPFYCAHLIKL